jgi:hypothetical protein
MARDAEYVASYAGDRTTRLLNLPQATAEQIGRELHRIAKTYRSGAYGTIGTYAGLNLLVHSEYNWCGTFDRNVFLVEGPSGLKYRCGQYGALLLGFAETSRYPEITLNRLPFMIEEQRRKIARLESELPALEAIVARTWGKTDELSRLRQECRALQQRIDEGLKEAERTQKPLAECGASDKAA